MSAHKSPHVAPWPPALDRVPSPMPLTAPARTALKLEPSFWTCVCDVWTRQFSAFSCSYVKVLEMKKTIYQDFDTFDSLMQEGLA